MTQETPPSVRAKLLMAASRLTLWEAACERSRELAQEALALYEVIEDVVGKTWAIFQIGDTWYMQGEYTPASRYLEESLQLLHEQEAADQRAPDRRSNRAPCGGRTRPESAAGHS